MIYKGACVLISDEGLLAGAGWESGNPFSRQMSGLSGIRDTVLGWRPTEKHFVWFFVFFGTRLVDRRAYSRVSGTPSWAGARQKSILSSFFGFRHPFSRQKSVLSDVLDTLMENGSCPPARAFSPEQND